MRRRLLEDLLDLVLPRGCAGCGLPGPAVCVSCARRVAGSAPRPLSGAAADLRGSYASPYAGPVVGLVLAHKDRAEPVCGAVLGAAVALAAAAAAPGGPLVLVPVPSSSAALRRRGFDHAALLAGHAATALRVAGRPAAVLPALRRLPGPDRGRRAAGERRDPVRIVSVAAVRGAVVLVDDVATTGGSLRAAVAALRGAGADEVDVAVAAAAARCRVRAGGEGSPERGCEV